MLKIYFFLVVYSAKKIKLTAVLISNANDLPYKNDVLIL